MSTDGLKIPLNQRWERMQRGSVDLLYYALTLTANANGQIIWNSQSSFVGWEDRKRGRELRSPSLMTKDFCELWKGLNQPYSFVHSFEDFSVFLLCGGNVLIEKAIAEKKLPDLLKPVAVAPHGPAGFKNLLAVEPSSLNRAATPRVRMQVLNRDQRRCKICGRRPDDDVDLELHVHHIRPSGKGGLSEPENLITLCDTCHTGLNPHDDWTLFGCVPEFANFPNVDHIRTSLMEGVTNYRKLSWAIYNEIRDVPSNPKRKQRTRGSTK